MGAYGVYYLYTNGYFEKIANAIKLPIPSGGEEKPAEEAPKEEDPASKCKSGETYDDKKKKCVKAKRAQIVSRGYVAAYRGWRPYRERITLG